MHLGGFVVEATFRTVPIKQFAATGLLILPNLAGATGPLLALLPAGFATIKLRDARASASHSATPR